MKFKSIVIFIMLMGWIITPALAGKIKEVPPIFQPDVNLYNISSKFEGGYNEKTFIITGEIKNTLNESVENITLTSKLFSSQRKLEQQESITISKIIHPEQSVPFKITFSNLPEGMAEFTVEVDYSICETTVLKAKADIEEDRIGIIQEDKLSICKCTIGTIMNQDPSIINGHIIGKIPHVSYNRPSDGKKFDYKCIIERDKVIWAMEFGRWRTEDDILYYVNDKLITIYDKTTGKNKTFTVTP